MKESTQCIIVGWIAVVFSVLLFIASPARLDGEMNPLSFFFCCIPTIIGLPCFELGRELRQEGK